jgi:hypothetical protein
MVKCIPVAKHDKIGCWNAKCTLKKINRQLTVPHKTLTVKKKKLRRYDVANGSGEALSIG